MNFADTNWLVALYSEKPAAKKDSWHITVANFMRKHGGQLALSQIVLLEARNIFSRLTKQASPPEWEEIVHDFGGKLYVDQLNWSLLRRDAEALFSRYSTKESIGTLDALVVVSAKHAGATRFLSFDSLAAALAAAEGLAVFPPLNSEGKVFLKKLSAN